MTNANEVAFCGVHRGILLYYILVFILLKGLDKLLKCYPNVLQKDFSTVWKLNLFTLPAGM